MEDDKIVDGNINDDTKGTGESGTQNTKNNEEKKYTQDDFNALDKKLKAKYEKKYEGIDLAKYKEWVESQKSAEQKQAEKDAEYAQKDTKISELQKEIAILKAGIKDEEDIDYVLYKVNKMQGDFEENLTKFLKDNPKYIEPTVVKKVSSSMSFNGKTQPSEKQTNQEMNDLIRSARDW